MKISFLTLLLCVSSFGFSQTTYLGLHGDPNSTNIFKNGTSSNVVDAVFSRSNDQGTATNLKISASISSSPMAPSGGSPNTQVPANMFGGQSNNTAKTLLKKKVMVDMVDVGTPSFDYYKSLQGNTGLDVDNTYAFEQYISTEGLMGQPTDGTYYMGTITYTFSYPISNPILHVTGLGGFFSSTYGTVPPVLLFSVDMEFIPNTTTISRLSGTSYTVLDGNTIKNSLPYSEYADKGTFGTDGNDAGSGSFLVSGSDITSVSFKMYMRGKVAGQEWSTVALDPNPKYTGDRFNTTWTLEESVLPINLLSFNAKKINNEEVMLNWETATEENFKAFDVEASTDGSKFSMIGQMKGKGSGSKYELMDRNPFQGVNYYRLKSVDLDGTYVYSNIKAVEISARSKGELAVYPNPFNQGFTLSNLKKGSEIKMYDIKGSVVYTNKVDESTFRVTVPQLQGGVYNVVVTNDTESISKRLIKID